MPNVWATKTGNWSDTTVWNTGTLPTAADAVWASGSTVLIDQDINVQSLNNFVSGTIGAGGTFNCFSSQTITASLFRAGTIALLNITGSGLAVNLVGTISSSTTTAVTNGSINIPNTFVGSTLNINGTFTSAGAAASSVNTLFAASGSTLNITGSIGTGVGAQTILNNTAVASTINISGSITPGTGGTTLIAAGTSNNYTITGSVISGGAAGSGINFTAISSSFNILGNLSSLVTTTNSAQFNINSIASTIRIIGNISGSTGQNSGLVLGGSYNTIIVTGSVVGHPSTSLSVAVIMGGYQNNLIISGSILPNVGGVIYFNNLTTPMTCSIIGDITTTGNGHGINVANSTGPVIINVSGSLYNRSTSSTTGYPLYLGGNSNTYNTTVNITGSVYAGLNVAANSGHGIVTTTTLNIVDIKGDVYGGTGSSYGVYNNGTNTVIISGSSIAGSSNTGQYGAVNNSTGILRVIGAVGSTVSPSLYGVSPFGITSFESTTFPTNGLVPLVGYCEMVVGGNSFASCSLSASGYNVLVDSNNITNGQPTASNVRLGTTYNFGSTSGSMAVPSASYVALGTPVDNTSGSLVISSNNIASVVWDTQLTSITTSGSIGDRLKNSATVANVGNQLVALM